MPCAATVPGLARSASVEASMPLSALAVERMSWAAEQADDPIIEAGAGSYRLAYTRTQADPNP
jgi:hypothetical protein